MRASPIYDGRLVLTASAVSEMLMQGATSYAAPSFLTPGSVPQDT